MNVFCVYIFLFPRCLIPGRVPFYVRVPFNVITGFSAVVVLLSETVLFSLSNSFIIAHIYFKTTSLTYKYILILKGTLLTYSFGIG